jgi:DNA-binding HxlR family transcriptional regulator
MVPHEPGEVGSSESVFELEDCSRRALESIAGEWGSEYSLTPLGETQIRVLAELYRWAKEHIEHVEAARLQRPRGVVNLGQK